MDKWDQRFLMLARTVASWSKDPSTQVGAALVRPDRTVASLGFNGFPRGVDDAHERYECRELKYLMTVHAECNAMHHARDPSLEGYTLYTAPLLPCATCAGLIIQAGITRVVSSQVNYDTRWALEQETAMRMFHEAGVSVSMAPVEDET